MRKNLITGSCFLFCLLIFNFNTGSMPEANGDVVSKKFTYHSLTGYELSRFEGFISKVFPEGKTVWQILTSRTSLRYETRLAQALLIRNYLEGETEWLLVPGKEACYSFSPQKEL